MLGPLVRTQRKSSVPRTAVTMIPTLFHDIVAQRYLLVESATAYVIVITDRSRTSEHPPLHELWAVELELEGINP